MLAAEVPFDAFNRMAFLTEAMLPLQKYLGLFSAQLGILPRKGGVLNYGADNIFNRDAINIHAFDSTAGGTSRFLIYLGKQLFAEPMLSENNKRSCITCHSPEKYFTDGMKKSVAFDGQFFVKRNAPSVLYAAYQHGNFWDARAKTLEAQILDVMASPNEMNAAFPVVENRLSRNKTYRRLFKKAFPHLEKDTLLIQQI